MRRSILFTALALCAQAAWAQEATDTTPDTGSAVVEETDAQEVASDETVETATESTEAVETEAEVPILEATDDTDTPGADGADVVSDDTDGPEMADDVTDEAEDVQAGVGEVEQVRTDNRAPTGAFHGGHRGSVSTMARAGLGSVFGKLRSQGYGDIAISQEDGMIYVSGSRQGEVRHLAYDATTGALVRDVSQSSGGILESLSSRFRPEPRGHGKADGKFSETKRGGGPKARGAESRGAKEHGGNKGGGSRGGGSKGGNSKGAGSKGGGSKGGGSKGGGHGNGNGGGKNR